MLSSTYLNGLSHQASTPASPASSAHELEFPSLGKRLEQFVMFEQEKNKFMSELVARHDYLLQKYQDVVSEHERQRDWAMKLQAENQQYERWIKNMQLAIAENSFVCVLINGDSMIFVDELLRQGEQGGRRAAAQLCSVVQNFMQHENENVYLGTRIICRVYANVQELGEKLLRDKVIDEVDQIEDFVRGFSQGQMMFDFIDVGAGENWADEKIMESLKFFSQDRHCQQLLIGCSHDNWCHRALKEYLAHPGFLDKLVFLGGVPFQKDAVSPPYDTKKFPGLFKDHEVVPCGGPRELIDPHASMRLTSTASPNIKTYNMLSGLPTRFPAPTRIPGDSLMDSPIPALASLTNLPRTPSSSTLASDGMPAQKSAGAANSWAAKAAAPAPSVPDSPLYKPAAREEVIARNRLGQRVDPPCKDYDKSEVDRIKKMKMCNVHFLRDECSYGATCTHLHAYQPTRDEISTLRLVARMAPCIHGSSCQDVKCIYGHRCPAPANKTHPGKGTKSCIFGESCKFPPELHDIDTNVVKTLVVR